MKTSSTPGSDDEGAVVSDNDLAQYMPQPDADGFIFPERILSNNNKKEKTTTTPVSRNVPSWPDSTCIDLTDDDPLPISAAAVVPVVDSSEDEEPTTRQHHQPRVESAFMSSSSAASSSSRETTPTPTPNTIEKSDPGYLDFDELMDDVEEEIDVTGMATSDEMDIQREDQQDMLTEEEYQLEEDTPLENSRVKRPNPTEQSTTTTTTDFDPAMMEDDNFDDFDISAELSDVNSSIFESPAPPPARGATSKAHRSSMKIPHQPAITTTTTTKVNDNTMIKTTARRIHLDKDMVVRSKRKKRRCNKLPTGYVYDYCMFYHAELEPLDGDAPHPESPYRILEIYKRLERQGLLDQCVRIDSRYASRQEILNVHEFEHYDKMRALEGKKKLESHVQSTLSLINLLYRYGPQSTN